ncbi:MAG: hypothetical protein Q8M31_23785 [Beijerinckiaceae bacterium]|nr:hypothetical protein [Beijerinckiaceae bacterium]
MVEAAAITPASIACQHIAYSPADGAARLTDARDHYLMAITAIASLVATMDRDLDLAAAIVGALNESIFRGNQAFADALALSLNTHGSA